MRKKWEFRGVFLSEFGRIVGSKREFSYPARELLGVFGRVYRSVLGSSVRVVMESRCDGIFGSRFGKLPLGESIGVNIFLSVGDEGITRIRDR